MSKYDKINLWGLHAGRAGNSDTIFMHYDRFDSIYKSIIPLKRVYVPEVMETGPV